MNSPEPSLFTHIIAGEIPADVVYDSERVIAFRDIAPKAPVHILVVPKTQEYRNVVELAAGDPGLLAEIVATAQRIATEQSNGQFRLVFNTGEDAGQSIFHVHAHLLSAGKNSAGKNGGGLTEDSLGSQ